MFLTLSAFREYELLVFGGAHMAKDTAASLQNDVIYSIFVRNHTKEGTFRSIIPDLPRIRALGVDVIWLMPIHPIGEVNRKGSLGSPYAIKDYRGINPEYGTMEDFQALVDAIHEHGMKVIIDVVYNHTSPDAVLKSQHPEYYYRKPNGSFGNHVGDWTDIIDLDYTNQALWKYQIDTLKMWAAIVDGFRCDVASFVPLAFWKKARKAVTAINPDCIWLAESVSQSFAEAFYETGVQSVRDRELFEAFDIEYEYDIHEAMEQYLHGETTIGHYLALTNLEEYLYDPNYNKLRFLENHDQPRIASRVKSTEDMKNLLAMLYFLKGTTLLYAGQEGSYKKQTSLFDKDLISFDQGEDLSPWIQMLGRIKKSYLEPEDRYFAEWNNKKDIVVLSRRGIQHKVGIFSLKSQKGKVHVPLSDGKYKNLLTGKEMTVANGLVTCNGKPMILVKP